MDEAVNGFELAPEEIAVRLRIKGAAGRHELLHVLRPPAFEDWREYERSLKSTVESVETNGEETLRFESSTLEAAAALYDRLFRRAEGYQGPNGSPEIAAEKVPLHHKEAVVRGLSEVAPASGDEESSGEGETTLFDLDAETVEVRLEASRGGQRYRDLAHIFRAPSAAERIEYSRIVSQALYVRGSTTLKSLLPSRLPGLAALYDRLIQEVRGYVVAGQPPADRASVARHMDPLHKKVAVQALFEE